MTPAEKYGHELMGLVNEDPKLRAALRSWANEMHDMKLSSERVRASARKMAAEIERDKGVSSATTTERKTAVSMLAQAIFRFYERPEWLRTKSTT